MSASVITARIEGWSFVSSSSDPYPDPGAASLRLMGTVQDHPSIAAGKHVTTSPVVAINYHARWVETRSGSIYLLGDVHPDYRAWAEQHCPRHSQLWGGQ